MSSTIGFMNLGHTLLASSMLCFYPCNFDVLQVNFVCIVVLLAKALVHEYKNYNCCHHVLQVCSSRWLMILYVSLYICMYVNLFLVLFVEEI